MPIARTQAVAFAAAAFAAAPLCAQDGGDQAFQEALERYKVCIARLPFDHHVEGWDRLAKTERPEALEILLEDYRKVKEYREFARYMLAGMLGRHFDDPASVEELRKLRLKHKKPGDMWLWVNALKVETNRLGADEVLEVARKTRSSTERAAAIAGLGKATNSKVFDAMFEACADFPRKESDRYVLLGAMTGAIYDNRDRVRTEEARAGMRAYISLLADDVKLPHTAKIQMARVLMWALDGPGLMIQPEPWLLLLEHGEKKPSRASGNTVTQPRFFGIETEGERFCYVVDMSDSMCKEISPEIKPKGPATGPKPDSKGDMLDESDLPWHKIRTRFDLAREHLKISLQRLSDEKYFSIVWFGTESGTLPSCPGLMRATKANVMRAIKDLDEIVPGDPDPVRSPDGRLRGNTNMHSGLLQAFSLSGKGFVDEYAYVDPGPLTEGCDTIFLLSDGAPSCDGFTCTDVDYGEGEVVIDREYGEKAARTPRINYHGPYVDPNNLVEDVGRMNAFRRVRIHCIGIGEANLRLLDRLADMGHGEVYVVGSGQRSGGGGGAGRPRSK